MYFVCDVCDDSKYGKIMSNKKMYELYVDEVANDAKANNLDYDIVSTCVDELIGLAKNNLVNDKYVIEGLEGYGWYVIDLLQLQRSLEDLKKLIGHEIVFDEVIRLINEKAKEN